VAASKSQDTPGVKRHHWIVAWFVLASGLGASVLSALNIIRRIEVGWPSGHPWSTAASIVIPVALVFLAFTFISSNFKKRIFAIIVLMLGLAGAVCGVLSLLA
jgi:hypothetical protein